jgi:hypothetical protein
VTQAPEVPIAVVTPSCPTTAPGTELTGRAFSPLRRRERGTFIPSLIRRHLGAATVELLVVNDQVSVSAAVDLLHSLDGSGPPGVAYSFDHAVPASHPPARHDRAHQQGDR